MRDHSTHIELARHDAVEHMLHELEECGFGATRSVRNEQVALNESFDRVLAEDVRVKTDVPNVLTCCLDSIAVHWDDFADLPDGQVPDTSDWVRGIDWEFANTGVAMPAGFDTAIVIEHVRVSDDEKHVELTAAPSERFAGTRPAGATMKRGQVALESGTLVTPDVAARIASAGHASVAVRPRPRVAFLPTGDELVPPNLPLSESSPEKFAGAGHVYESNSAVVQGKVEAWGGVFAPFDIIADEYDAIKEAVLSATKVADIVVLNAGSSKGSEDWSVEVLEEIGRVIYHQTNHGPGHHSFFAMVEDVPVVGISGPSGGVSFTLEFYLQPAMKAFLGLDPHPVLIPARLKGSFGKNRFARKEGAAAKIAGEERPPEATTPGSSFYSVRFMELIAEADGTLSATPVAGKAGAPETQHANAMYMLPAAADAVFPEEGTIIEVELRSGCTIHPRNV